MKRILLSLVAAAALAAPTLASAKPGVEGRWANAKRSVIVAVARCGSAYCATVDWATAHNREKGVEPGTRVLSDLRPQGGGVYKGRVFEPKRDISGSATVRQVGPNTMVVKGCALIGLICKEQRWTRVGS
jgi:uncharacterized protein (DUF2147 family)